MCLGAAGTDDLKQNNPYPSEELEWIAATSFNHAVSCFCVKDDANCQIWAEKAMNVASLMDDGGSLLKQISSKYSQLGLGGQ